MIKGLRSVNKSIRKEGDIDVDNRDYPAAFQKNYKGGLDVIFGKKDESHTELLNRVLQTETEEGFKRDPYENEEDVFFGHVVGKYIVIDTWCKDIETVRNLVKNSDIRDYEVVIYDNESKKLNFL